MKKLSKLLLAMIVFMSATTVFAKTLDNPSQSENIEEYFSDASGTVYTFEKSEEGEDVTYLNVAVNITSDFINKVLNHVPGKDNTTPQQASVNTVYFGIKTGLDVKDKTLKVNSVKHDGSDIEAAKKMITYSDEDITTLAQAYSRLIQVQYYDEAAKEWKNVSGEADGVKTIKNYLETNLGSSVTDADYGKKYRFYVDVDNNTLWGFEVTNSTEEKDYYYVNVSYSVDFGIAAGEVEGSDAFWFPTLEDALESGLPMIVVNSEVTSNEDIEIPEDVVLVITDKGSVELTGDAKLTVNGYVFSTNKSSIKVGDKEVYVVNAITDENGKVVVEPKLASKGEEVKLTVTPNKGYKLGTLNAYYLDGEKEVEIEVKDNTFTMPEADVYVLAEFVEDVESPNTGDINLALIISTITIATAGIAIVGKKMLKNFN